MIHITYTLKTNCTEENYKLIKTKYELNEDETIVENFRENLKDIHFPIFLRERNEKDFPDCTQDILISESLELTNFSDDDYEDGTATFGLQINKDDYILTHEISVNEEITREELKDKKIPILGEDYIVSYSDENKIEFLKHPLDFNMKENEVITLKTESFEKNFSAYFVNIDTVIITFGDYETERINQEGIHNGQNFTFIIRDIDYSNSEDLGLLDITISPNKILFDGNELFYEEDEEVEGIEISYEYDNDFIDKILVKWKAPNEIFLTSTNPLTFPYFENLILSLSERMTNEDRDYYWEPSMTAKSCSYEWIKS
jgi:hypothetical protein